MHLDQNVALRPLHTFGTEAMARYFVEAKTHSEVLTLLTYRHMIRMPVLFLGGGSNILFINNFTGIVIRINSTGILIQDEDEKYVTVTAEAGENWDDFVGFCVGNKWAGLENLSLIPGTVGAAPIQNIGAYGAEIKDVIESVDVAEIETGKLHRYANSECRFGYRDSIFKRELKGKVIILNVTFRLRKVEGGTSDRVTRLQGDRETGSSFLRIDYGGIHDELDRMEISNPGIADVRKAVISIRRRKLPDPAETGNAGSFFKNPVVSGEQFRALRTDHPDMPFYPAPGNIPPDPDSMKIPAAWLIEQCGWKGYRSGDAGVYPGHSLVLVNYGNATGREIFELATRIMESVAQKFRITLETEVNIVG